MRILVLVTSLCISLISFSQFDVTGTVRSSDGEPLPGVTVFIDGTFQGRSTDSEGRFLFESLSELDVTLQFNILGYSSRELTLNLEDNLDIEVVMEREAILVEEFTIIGERANERVPMAYTNIKETDLADRNLGLDVPALLDVSPSLYFTSDAGTGIGYSYLRLRGSDQTSINVSINGVPLNDPESHGVFWVNMPDLSSSTESIQIQRGVGSSVNGAGSFGGSVNIKTSNVHREAFGSLAISGGSFNTRKVTVEAGSGLLNDHWSMDARLSSIRSDGFIERSAAELSSYYLSGVYTGKKSTLRLLSFGGNEVTQQAWFGVPRARVENDVEGMLAFAADNGFSPENTQRLLESNRRYNYYTYDNEVDNYTQSHYQLHYSRALKDDLYASVSLHYTRGFGYFEQFQDDDNAYDDTDYSSYGLEDPVIGSDTLRTSDFIRRRWLDNHFYGMTSSLNWKRSSWNHSIGLAANSYEGGHYGEVLWARIMGNGDIRDKYYENDALKSELNAYYRGTIDLSKGLNAFIDLQQRYIQYSYDGQQSDGSYEEESREFSFFNPKAGMTYIGPRGNRAFLSYARAHKEPNRDDHIDATELEGPFSQRLDDVEVGYTWRKRNIAVEIVAYAMEYKDQLINTGEVNDVGESIRTNVNRSYRKGLEVILSWKPFEALVWNANATWSRNKILNHSESVVDYDQDFNSTIVVQELGSVDISFSPALMGYSEWIWTAYANEKGSKVDLRFSTKYVGEQQLDNTGDENRVLDAFLVNDLALDYHLFPEHIENLSFNVQLRNVFNEEYSSNGWTYRYLIEGQEQSFDALFPQAGRNILFGLRLNL